MVGFLEPISTQTSFPPEKRKRLKHGKQIYGQLKLSCVKNTWNLADFWKEEAPFGVGLPTSQGTEGGWRLSKPLWASVISIYGSQQESMVMQTKAGVILNFLKNYSISFWHTKWRKEVESTSRLAKVNVSRFEHLDIVSKAELLARKRSQLNPVFLFIYNKVICIN